MDGIMWWIIRHFKEKTSRSTYSTISKLVGKISCTYWCIGHRNQSDITQQEDDGMDYPIVYSSRKLNKSERNYSITETEALGMVFML